jgi:uncharacterized protein
VPKLKEYDLLIVGAGPAGMFACYEIVNKNPKLKIGLIDMGNRVEKRTPKEVMSGFGGAGTYSDGKLHFTPKLSHERAFDIISPEEYQTILNEIDDIFTKFGVKAETFPKNPEVVEEFEAQAQRHEIELIVRKAKHVGTDNLKKVITKIQKYLEDKNGVEIITNTKVDDLIMEKGVYKGVITDKGNFYSKKILLSPGRVMATLATRVKQQT